MIKTIVKFIRPIVGKSMTLHYFYRGLISSKQYHCKKMIYDYFNNGSVFYFENKGILNKDKFIYSISEGEEQEIGAGFFALVNHALLALQFSDKFQLTPYIFWGAYTEYSKFSSNKFNTFEQYFKQVSSLTKNEVNQSQHVYQSRLPYDTAQFVGYDGLIMPYKIKVNDLNEMARMYKKYIQLADEIEISIEHDIKHLLGNKKTVGVHVRGTDFKQNLKYHPHPIPFEEHVKAAKKMVEETGAEQVFLATDDLEAVTLFKQIFGSHLVMYEGVKRAKGDKGIHTITGETGNGNEKFEMGYEVLRDAYTLSNCSALVAGYSQVSLGTRIIKLARDEQFEKITILSHGINK